MKKCDYYHEEYEIIGWLGPYEQIRKLRKRCNGTRERDECSCGGDRTKCDFYPDVRAKEKNESGKIVTNADRIRAMTDDELADFFYELVDSGACNDFGITHERECDSNCVECIKEWLNQPVKE